ncbi:MAG: cation diffusion facilitator family transporter [Butyrivibrio sp.]|nr:cation diffusion facilitator family transporter [Butyrivibrio sp.]
MDRTGKIVITSVIGIVANLFLSAFKAVIGLISGSVSITLDAVNNLSDAMSSLITIIGAKLSAKEPDRKHPYGYGRIEYLSTMAIGGIIAYAGITSLIESIQKIIHPSAPEHTTASLIIIGAAILVKIWLGLFTKSSGVKYDSESLVASGKDALNDAIISTSTLIAAIIFITTHINIEAFIGLIIAIMIIKTAYETIETTISELLGERVPATLSRAVKNSIKNFPEVYGVYDLVIHDYGKDRMVGSAHIEVDESLTAAYLDGLERSIAEKVYEDTGVALSGISIYSANINDTDALEAKSRIKALLPDFPGILQMHGFYFNRLTKVINFDIVIDFDVEGKQKTRDELADKVQKLYPDYEVKITIDYDFSD